LSRSGNSALLIFYVTLFQIPIIQTLMMLITLCNRPTCPWRQSFSHVDLPTFGTRKLFAEEGYLGCCRILTLTPPHKMPVYPSPSVTTNHVPRYSQMSPEKQNQPVWVMGMFLAFIRTLQCSLL
jgi:hypothetical protein